MKVSEALTECQELKPSQYSDIHMLRWLSELEGKIIAEIINTHARDKNVVFSGYDESSMETEMTVPEPYSDLYVQYLMSMIDYYNGESARYQSTAGMFNTKYQEFANYWNREHRSTLPSTIK